MYVIHFQGALVMLLLLLTRNMFILLNTHLKVNSVTLKRKLLWDAACRNSKVARSHKGKDDANESFKDLRLQEQKAGILVYANVSTKQAYSMVAALHQGKADAKGFKRSVEYFFGTATNTLTLVPASLFSS